MASNKEEFQMTREELHSLEKAMKDAEFRKLLVEYAEEISNPENRKKYEEEIAMMENERGMNVKFVNPKPGFVAKTHQVGDGVKVFVNICQNENIQKATATMSTRKTGTESQKGEQWSIPYSLAVGREDVDKAGDKCLVYDVVFHPDTYQKALQDARFKKLLISTALEGVEKQFNVQLDKENVKLPKLKFKGVAKSTVIRTPKSGASEAPPAPPDLDIGGIKLPYPYDNNPEETSKPKKKSSKLKIEEESGPVTPKYSIVHRGHVDMQNFTNARDSSQGTRPKELVISIDLPLLDSAANVDLDVFERQLTLESSNPAYLLDISLPYPVKEEEGAARFDKSKRQLVVTLPVIPAEVKSIDSLFSPVVEIISAENEQDTASEHDSGVSSPRSTSNMEDTSVTRDQIPEQETPETEPSVNTESKISHQV